MPAMYLESNKIHHIPVRVTYTVPSIPESNNEPQYYSTGYAFPQPPPPIRLESTYTTTCQGLVPVFVHDVEEGSNRRSKRRKIVKEEDGVAAEEKLERVASVCLKSLIKAICLSSPEIIPSQSTSDLKIYTRPTVTSPAASRSTRGRRIPDSAFPTSTPGLSSSRSRSSSVVHQIATDPVQSSPWHPDPYSRFRGKSEHASINVGQHGFLSSSPYMAHGFPILATPNYLPTTTSVQQEEQVYQPRSTIASILLEKGTGKTTVTGRLIPAESHMLEDCSFENSASSGVEALARLAESGIPAILDVELLLALPIKTDGIAQPARLEPDRERAVYDVLGLVGETEIGSSTCSDIPMDTQSGIHVKEEPDWTSFFSTPFDETSSKTETFGTISSREPLSSSSGPTLRPFRPTLSKMAIFESQSRNRNQGMNGRRRRHHLHSDSTGATDSHETSPSNIFSRTRSRTRLGMGTMLEQVANVDNVVRLARKNPSALVERFLSGHTATSPVKAKGNASGFTIDALPKARSASTVKTLNIATGSSKKRKVVSVVLDESGRPVRWGAGTASVAVNMVPVNRGPGPTAAKAEGRGPVAAPASGKPTQTAKSEAETQSHFGRNLPICSNCGITESNTWRTKGKGGQRVCNACGLYWNNKGKMRPKELWEKDIARWKKRRAKAATKEANGKDGRATTAATPAAKDSTVKFEAGPSGQRSSISNPPAGQPNMSHLAPPQAGPTTSLKRNLSAVAEKEAQLHADHRKTHLAKSRKEQLADMQKDAIDMPDPATARGNKENLSRHARDDLLEADSARHAVVSRAASKVAEPHPKRNSASTLQPVNVNPPLTEVPPTPLTHVKESPEAVLKRYLGETVFTLGLANNMPLSDDGSRESQANTRSRSPATSPTEIGSVIHSADDAIEWGDANDLAGLFEFSQKAESAGSFATTENQCQGREMPIAKVKDNACHLGGDEFAMMGMDDQQDEAICQDETDYTLELDPFGDDITSGAQSGASSSPVRQPFDFSQLPNSSPPILYDHDEVDHAAALWSSSPETSPVDFGTISVKEISPMKPMGEDMDGLLQSLEKSAQAEALRLINESI